MKHAILVLPLLLAACAHVTPGQVNRSIIRMAAAFCEVAPEVDECAALDDSELTIEEKIALAKAVLRKFD